MKKFFVTLFATLFSLGQLIAQNDGSTSYDHDLDMDVFNAIASIFVLIIVLIFILTMVRQFFENKIKNKIVDKGISESQISSILQSGTGDRKYVNIKWFALMAGIGIGLTIINYTMPLGIHSLAIMSFSIASSFLGYYYFLQKQTRK